MLGYMRKKIPGQQLSGMIAEASEMIPPESLWRHYKGGVYRVVCIAFDEETLDFEVVYEPIDSPEIHFTRRMVIWLESVDWEGVALPRFERMTNHPETLVDAIAVEPLS